ILGEQQLGLSGALDGESVTKLGQLLGVQAISKDQMSQKAEKDLWTKGSLFASPKPNIALASKIGKQLGVEVVFMYDIDVGSQDSPAAKFVFYLINVHPKGMFYHSSQTSDFEDRGHSSFKNLVEKVLKNYLG
ncbi:MAG: hypothetical protein V3S66_02980, partial [Desulfobacterales bacterium]